jgi:hypothetical protein
MEWEKIKVGLIGAAGGGDSIGLLLLQELQDFFRVLFRDLHRMIV